MEGVHVFPDALPRATLALLRAAAAGVAAAPNFWVPRAAIEAGPAAARTAADRAVAELYRRVMRPRLPGDWAGAEYWVQVGVRVDCAGGAGAGAVVVVLLVVVVLVVGLKSAACLARSINIHHNTNHNNTTPQPHKNQIYEPGRGLAFHFDKDEHLLIEEGRMAHPAWSSVLYLTGSDGGDDDDDYANGADGVGGSKSGGGNDATAAQPLLREGPTVVIDQVFDAAAGRPEPEEPTASVLAWPKARTYLIFDGRLGHGVLDSLSGARRATLLVNWWRGGRPRAVREATDAQLDEFGIPRLITAADDVVAGAAAAGGGGDRGGAGPAAAAAADALGQGLAGVRISGGSISGGGGGDGGGDKSAAAATATAAAAADDDEGDLVAEAPVPEVRAPAAAGLDHAVTVDALLAAVGLRLTGRGAVSAVCVRHPGLVLLPLDPEHIKAQQRAAAAAGGGDGSSGDGGGLQTAAALVPPSMLPSSEEEEGEDEEGSDAEEV